MKRLWFSLSRCMQRTVGRNSRSPFLGDHEKAVSEALGQVFTYANGARNLILKHYGSEQLH